MCRDIKPRRCRGGRERLAYRHMTPWRCAASRPFLPNALRFDPTAVIGIAPMVAFRALRRSVSRQILGGEHWRLPTQNQSR
jgi:hypothetical protein